MEKLSPFGGSPFSTYSPTGLWVPNASKCNGQIKLKKEFLKALYDISKNTVHKIISPAVKSRTFFIFLVAHIRAGLD